MRSVELLVGLLDGPDPACISTEDFTGPHGSALRAWQVRGFLDREPSANPSPSCPYCEDGVPYLLGGRYLCHRCRSVVDPQQLMLWRFDREAFLGWVEKELQCRGGLRPVDAVLWQLGTRTTPDGPRECFYRWPGILSERGHARLSAYQNVLVLFGLSPPADGEAPRGRRLSLLEILSDAGPLSATDPERFLRPGHAVRFDPHSGALWAGNAWLGEVPIGCKEYFFLARLAADLDHFVPYADLKRDVLRRSGGADETEEATFCQKLKNRVKKRYVPRIDQFLVTTNKGDGYRLRGHGEVS